MEKTKLQVYCLVDEIKMELASIEDKLTPVLAIKDLSAVDLMPNDKIPTGETTPVFTELRLILETVKRINKNIRL